MHRKSKGLLGEISTMSIMKVYPKPILREMHDFWCQEREEARVDRVESAVCDHWEDVRGGGFYITIRAGRRARGGIFASLARRRLRGAGAFHVESAFGELARGLSRLALIRTGLAVVARE